MSDEKSSQNMLEAIMKQMIISERPPSSEKKSFNDFNKGKEKLTSYRSSNFPDIFSQEEKSKIKTLLSTSLNFEADSNLEIEASFGIYKRDFFSPGLRSLSQFNNLKRCLDNLTRSKGGTFYLKTYSDKIDIIQGQNIRRISDRKGGNDINPIFSYQKKCKFTSNTIDNKTWGVRISKSKEDYVDEIEFDHKKWEEIENLIKNPSSSETRNLKNVAIQRLRDRQSYIESDSDSKFYGLKFDLSTVNEIYIRENGTTYNAIQNEVEIERIKDCVNLKDFIYSISFTIQCYENASVPQQVINQEETRLAISLHNQIFENDIRHRRWLLKDPYKIFGDYWNKPKNIKLEYMLEKRFDPSVTIKLDGKRYSLLFSIEGTYIFNPPYDIMKIGPGIRGLEYTLLDCEFINVYDNQSNRKIISEIYAFDILFFKGKDVRRSNFQKRLELLNKISEEMVGKLYEISYHTKKYFRSGNFYDKTRKALEEIKDNQDYQKYNLVDGLIFQPGNYYKNDDTFKWKEEKDLTIDFEFIPFNKDEMKKFNKEEEVLGSAFWLMVGDQKENIKFLGSKKYPFPGYVYYEKDLFDSQTLSYKVVECYWDKNKKTFLPRIIREDRDRPNHKNTVADIWEDIKNPIPKATIEGNTLQLMRKYHNSSKLSILKKDFSEKSTIIDIGSGRGGDLQKWGQIGIKKIYTIEPNSENSKELLKRLEDNSIKSKVILIPNGAEETSVISDELKKGENLDSVSGIVSFFSLTFFPKNKKMYDNLLSTINLLPKNGKFVGIVLDGQKVRDLLDNVRKSKNISENKTVEYITEAYSIRQISEFDDDPIGNEIEININDSTSMVKEQIEWLFYFEPFKKKLEEIGFELISTGFLDNGEKFNMLPESSKVFSGLNRTFSFQKKDPVKENFEIEELKPDEMVKSYELDEYGNYFYYLGVQEGPSSFIHAVLRAISIEYYNLNKEERIEYVDKIRKSLAKKITVEIFDNLHNGLLSKCLQRKYLLKKKYSKEESLEKVYSKFMIDFLNVKKWIGENFFLEIISMVLEINIYIFKFTDEKEFILLKTFSVLCDKIYNNPKSIVLLSKNEKYYVVAKQVDDKVYTVYNSSSSFIKTLYNQLCG